MKPAEVAATFGVNGKAIERKAESGAFLARRTLAGRHRYRPSDAMRLMKELRAAGRAPR